MGDGCCRVSASPSSARSSRRRAASGKRFACLFWSPLNPSRGGKRSNASCGAGRFLRCLPLPGRWRRILWGQSLYSGFAVIAGLLLGAALLLPILLAGALRLGETRARAPLAQWFWADSRQQLPGLSLALTALLLALATNVGIGGMVEGFRQTFTHWLDGRLVEEVYFEAAGAAEAQRIEIVALDAAGRLGGAADGENDRRACRLADPGRRDDLS